MDDTQTQPLDVVIPYHSKDAEILEYCLAGCRQNIPGLRTIYLITDHPVIKTPDVVMIHQDDYFSPKLTLQDIRKRWAEECPANAHRAGWLFQQLIKLASCYAIPELSNDYLILDADVIWLKPSSFFEDGKILISPSKEHHQPYYECVSRLIGDTPRQKYSFVSHHFPVKKKILKELLDRLEKRWNKVWYEAILDHLDFSELACFSEYETIGLYLQTCHPEVFRLRSLRNIQSFKWKYLPLILCGAADYITIHDYKKPARNPKTSRLLYSLFLWTIQHKLK
jgi:hypothetical protein